MFVSPTKKGKIAVDGKILDGYKTHDIWQAKKFQMNLT